MFSSLKNILPRALEKNNLNAPIQQIERKEKTKEIVQNIIGEGVEIVRCQRELVVRVKHHILANEIRLREREIKGRLKEEGIIVEVIKYA